MEIKVNINIGFTEEAASLLSALFGVKHTATIKEKVNISSPAVEVNLTPPTAKEEAAVSKETEVATEATQQEEASPKQNEGTAEITIDELRDVLLKVDKSQRTAVLTKYGDRLSSVPKEKYPELLAEAKSLINDN